MNLILGQLLAYGSQAAVTPVTAPRKVRAREAHPRAFSTWDDREVSLLQSALRQGLDYCQVSIALRRTSSEVASRAQNLAVVPWPTRDDAQEWLRPREARARIKFGLGPLQPAAPVNLEARKKRRPTSRSSRGSSLVRKANCADPGMPKHDWLVND